MSKKGQKAEYEKEQTNSSRVESDQQELYRSFDAFLSRRYDSLSAEFGLAKTSAEQEELPYVIELNR